MSIGFVPAILEHVDREYIMGVVLCLCLALMLPCMACSPKTCDTSLQKEAGSNICDDDVNAAILKQKTDMREILSDLDDQLICVKLKGDMLRAGDSSTRIKHELENLGRNMDCTTK